MIKQISINMPNVPGKMAQISDLMASEGLNVRAILLDERGADSGVVRYIVEDPIKAGNLLKSRNYDYQLDDVLAIVVPDHPGGLGAVVKPLRDHKINIRFLYPAIGRYGTNAILILGADKNEEAAKVLQQNYIQLLGEEVYKL